MILYQNIGDSKTHGIPLRWNGRPFVPGTGWTLTLKVKASASQADALRLFEKSFPAYGITVSGSTASVEVTRADTFREANYPAPGSPAFEAAAGEYVWDIQAYQIAAPNHTRTVASGTLTLNRDVTRLSSLTGPIFTTEDPVLVGATAGFTESLIAADFKDIPADNDLLALVDSAAVNVLKKLKWSALKATLKSYFDPLYQAAGSYAPASGIAPTTITGTAVITTDSRLSDSRSPTSHNHGNISNSGAIGTATGLPIITTASGVLTTGFFGTSSGQFAQGNHTHTASGITDFASAARGEVESTLAAGTGVTITPIGSGASRTLTVSLTPPYLVPAFSAFSITGPTSYANGAYVEVGTTFASTQTFSWTTTNTENINPNTVSITNLTGNGILHTAGANTGPQTISGLGSPTTDAMTTAGKSFRIKARNSQEVDFTRDLVLNGVYPWFWGKVASTTRPTANAALVTSGTKVVASGGGTLTIPFASATGDYLWFAVPETQYGVKTAWYATALNNGAIGGATDLFPAHATVSVISALWSGIPYRIYVSSYPTSIPSLQVS